MVRSIQYLRGIAALLVVLYHTRGYLNFPIGTIPNIGDFLFANGYFGVDLFFIISGFVIVLSTQKKQSPQEFITKRAFRVYPIYLFCLLTVLYLSPQQHSVSEIIRALFLIQANYSEPAPWFGYSIVFVAWTLSYEILFYAIFCIAISISHKHRVMVSSLFIIAISIASRVFLDGYFSLDGYYAIAEKYGVLRFITSPMLYEFIAGMFLALFYINRDKLNFIRPAVPLISSAGIMYFILFYFNWSNGGHGLSNSGVVAFSLLMSLLLIEVFYGIENNKTLSTLGDLSYSIYLNQAIIFIIYPLYFAKENIIQPSVMLIQTGLVISLSFITYNYIEKPSINAARTFIKLISKKTINHSHIKTKSVSL